MESWEAPELIAQLHPTHPSAASTVSALLTDEPHLGANVIMD
jgi:hypothetical protein